jgi:hypothetical protein
LQAIINRHATESGSWVRYAGTQDGYHYLVNNHALSSRTYRVAATELRIADTLPYTNARKAWRSLRWDLQPLGGEGVSGHPIGG